MMRYKVALYLSILIVLPGFYASGQKYLNGEATITVRSESINRQKIILEGPSEWVGLKTLYQIGTEYSGEGKLNTKNGSSSIEFYVDFTREEIIGKPFLFYINNFPLIVVHSVYESVNANNNIRNNATTDQILVRLSASEVGINQDWVLLVNVSQKPGMLSLLQTLSESNLKDGTIFMIIASHQDTGWEDTPYQCEINRDQKIITPALELLKDNPDYKFNVENMLSLMEYLERNPQKKDEIFQFTKEGRLSWGGTYNQPYEEIYSGESLARQFYFGRKWFKENFKGLDTRTAWNVDVPGRTLQSPQLMAKAGIKYLIISRQQQGLFDWQSPDGSKVKVYSPGDYGETWRQLQRTQFRLFRHFADYALEYQKYNGNAGKDAVIPFMANKDMSPPFLYKEVIDEWNKLDSWETSSGEKMALNLPKIEYATPERFFSALDKTNPKLPVLKGERPNVWLYIHGPSHHDMLSAIREGGILLTAAEKFATFNSLLENNWDSYPQLELNRIWKEHIYPDHGLGGKNGHITDQIFLDKTINAKNTAHSILMTSLNSIAAKINFGGKKGIPLVVFNSRSSKRTNPVQVKLNLKGLAAKGFRLEDYSGKPIPYQTIDFKNDNKGDISQIEIAFIAENVPSLGYKTYFIVPSKNINEGSVQKRDQITSLENNHYRIELGRGGIIRIKDKDLNRDLFKTDKFLCGELFSMQSVGTGAGEFAQVQQPTMEGFEKMSDYQPFWQNYQDGALYQSVELVQKINHTTVKQKIILYHQIKKIDFQLSLLNWEGIQFREFRLALPVDMTDAHVTYEVPFGKVEIGKDEMPGVPGERYLVKASEIRPRSILNWISVNDDEIGITFSSSVAAWDYLDPTDQPVSYPILQPILLASRRSCHGQGNWYLQEGDHQFNFSLTSHPADWKKGYHQAIEHNEPLIAVFNPVKVEEKLPLELSFISIDKANVSISTIKKSENEDKTIMRIYETEGLDSKVKIDSYFNFNKSIKCNLIEEDQNNSPKKPQVEIGKFAIETFKLY